MEAESWTLHQGFPPHVYACGGNLIGSARRIGKQVEIYCINLANQSSKYQTQSHSIYRHMLCIFMC